jgi:hypothetical protein
MQCQRKNSHCDGFRLVMIFCSIKVFIVKDLGFLNKEKGLIFSIFIEEF